MPEPRNEALGRRYECAANAICYTRFAGAAAMAGTVMVTGRSWYSAGLMIGLGVSDKVDGWLARRGARLQDKPTTKARYYQ